MTLQASGTISLMQVNQELGRGAFSTISLNVFNTGGVTVVQTGAGNVTINQCSPSRPNGSAPTSMNEWYNYNHNASCGDPYPCSVNSNITTSGAGYSTLIYDNYGFLWTSESLARAARGSGAYQFNVYAGYDSSGNTLGGTSVIVGNILKNNSVSDGRNRCGYILWSDNTQMWILALDKSGQIIEKVL